MSLSLLSQKSYGWSQIQNLALERAVNASYIGHYTWLATKATFWWLDAFQLPVNRKIERVVHYIELIYSYFLHSLKWITRIDCQSNKLRVQQRCTWLRYATLNTIYRYYLYVSHTCQNFPETSKQSTIRQKFFRIFFFPNNGRCVTVRINEAIKICIELI